MGLKDAIASSIRRAHQDRGWTYQRLSDESGRSLRTVQRFMRGHTFSLDTADDLASALELDRALERALEEQASEPGRTP